MTVGRFKFVVWCKAPIIPVGESVCSAHAPYPEDCDTIKAMAIKYEWSYYHVAHEKCPTNGRDHLDGYYEYPTQRKVSTERKKFAKAFGPGFGDLEVARGCAGENMDYSEKEGRYFHKEGTPGGGQGTRTDLINTCEAVKQGTSTVEDIVDTDPMTYHQYGRTLHKLEDIYLRKKFRNWMTTCQWIHGPTETGKSARAFEGFNPDTHYVWKTNDNGWQDGYIGQEQIIINDFRGEIPYNELLQMIDRYPHYVKRRSREPAPFLAKHIVITSSLHPEAVYRRRLAEDSIEQLLRRIDLLDTTPEERPVEFTRHDQWISDFPRL